MERKKLTRVEYETALLRSVDELSHAIGNLARHDVSTALLRSEEAIAILKQIDKVELVVD